MEEVGRETYSKDLLMDMEVNLNEKDSFEIDLKFWHHFSLFLQL